MVKRSRDQSQEAPRRLSWRTMVPPDSSFHSQTRWTNSSRPRSRRWIWRSVELALDDHLRGDAGMVHARLPQHVLAAHALEAAEDVLDRVVEGVPHVERAGHVRRRDDDRVRFRALAILAAGLEGLGLLPAGGDARLDGGGIERLVHHDEYRPVGATNAQARRLQTGRIGRSQQRRDNLRAVSICMESPRLLRFAAFFDGEPDPLRRKML